MAAASAEESPKPRLDKIDRKILAILQDDAATPLQ